VSTNRSPLAGTLIVLTGAALFAFLGPLSRFAYERGLDPLAFVTWRTGLAALALGGVVWWRSWVTGTTARPAYPGRRAAGSIALATLAGLLLNVAIFSAFERTTVALALLGFYTYPAMVAAVAVAFGRERATGLTLVSLGVAVGGMVLVLLGGLDPAGDVRFDLLGLLLAVTAAAFQTVFITISRDGYRTVPADQAMGIILAGTSLSCLVVAVAAGVDLGLPLRDGGLLAIMLGAGVLGAAIPSLMFLVGIRLVGGTRAGILMLFEPVVGVALAALLLGESLGPVQALGGFAILAAAALLQRVPVAHGAPRAAGAAGAAGPEAVPGEDEQADEDALVAHVPGGP
jgi:drug/metabolite transporter (DMT)-like permease